MQIGGTTFKVRPWPEIKTIPAITWKRTANGYNAGRDRGASNDIYTGKILISGLIADIDSVQSILDANRGNVTLSSFSTGEILFGANVDYSGSITATVIDFGIRKNVMMNSVHEITIEFRAISPTLLGTTPSLDSLRVQEGWAGDRSTDVTKLFSYDQTASYLEQGTDSGVWEGRFIQTLEEMKAIRAYLLTTARANPITFPYLYGVPFYPFGSNEADSRIQKCHVMSFSDKRLNLNRFELNITFAQAEPYFSAGTEADDYSDLFLASPSDTPTYYATPGG